MKITEALGVYAWQADPSTNGFSLVAIPPGGQPMRGQAVTIQQVGDMIADVERQIRAQLGRPN